MKTWILSSHGCGNYLREEIIQGGATCGITVSGIYKSIDKAPVKRDFWKTGFFFYNIFNPETHCVINWTNDIWAIDTEVWEQ